MTQKRDYSTVAWPWVDDPNWAAPREGATSNPADDENWAMECSECALRFPEDITVETVANHWVEQHHPEQVEDPKPSLNLVWVGLGVPPKGKAA